jgi:hypothetical protein
MWQGHFYAFARYVLVAPLVMPSFPSTGTEGLFDLEFTIWPDVITADQLLLGCCQYLFLA